MSYNGSGTFQINSTGQPVVSGTVISSTAFNALTADLATGLSTAITKDGQTATTARIPFAAGINSTLVTDSSSTATGSIITAGGVGIAKALYVGTTANFGGVATYSAQPIFSSLTASSAVATDASKGLVSVTNTGTGNNVLGTGPTVSLPVIDNIKMGYSTTATAAGTTTLTAASNHQQFFTGTLAQTIVLPVTSTLALGLSYSIENNSTGTLTVQSSGLNTIATIPAGITTLFTCTLVTGTTAASWDYDQVGFAALTGTGSVVLATSPILVTPALGTPSALVLTNATGLPQAGLATNVVGNGPAFSAYASTNQTVSDGTATKILFDTEEFDTNSNFSSSRFTPTVAGYYQVNATVNCSQTAIVDFVIWIYKNNITYKRGFGFAGTASKFIAPVSTLVYLNGSTDYVEVFLYSDGTGNATINASSQDVWFNGCLVRSA